MRGGERRAGDAASRPRGGGGPAPALRRDRSAGLAEYDRRSAHLTRVFASRRIAGIGQGHADAYVLRRQEQGVVGATIRRELGTLTGMLRLAYKNGKLLRLPLLDKPKEGPPREGWCPGDASARLSPDGGA